MRIFPADEPGGGAPPPTDPAGVAAFQPSGTPDPTPPAAPKPGETPPADPIPEERPYDANTTASVMARQPVEVINETFEILAQKNPGAFEQYSEEPPPADLPKPGETPLVADPKAAQALTRVQELENDLARQKAMNQHGFSEGEATMIQGSNPAEIKANASILSESFKNREAAAVKGLTPADPNAPPATPADPTKPVVPAGVRVDDPPPPTYDNTDTYQTIDEAVKAIDDAYAGIEEGDLPQGFKDIKNFVS